MKLELKPKWRVKSHPHIKLTNNRMVFNSNTGRLKKITVNGGSIGIWLDNKTFLVRSKLKENIELEPKKEYCPF
jgi:hypothetical protein